MRLHSKCGSSLSSRRWHFVTVQSMVKVVTPVAQKGKVCKRPAAAIPIPQPSPCDLPVVAAHADEVAVPAWLGEADAEKQNQVVLVTAAKLVNEKDDVETVGDSKPLPLRDPASITKLEFRKALQDSVQNPMHDLKRGGRPSSRAFELDVYMGVKEGSAEEQHHHAA